VSRLELILVLLLASVGGTRGSRQAVPAFQLENLQGRTHSITEPDGNLLIVFWNPEMKASVKALGAASRIAEKYPELGVWTIVSGHVARESIEQARHQFFKGAFEVLLDPERVAFSKMHVVAVPTFFVVGSNGTIRLRVASMPPDLEIRLGRSLDEVFGRGGEAHQTDVEDPEADPEFPAAAKRRLTLARLLFVRGLPSEAEATLIDLMSRYPQSFPIHVAAFYQALDFQLWEVARAALGGSRRLRPDSRDAIAGEVYLLARTGQLDRAAELKELVAPDDPHRELLDKIVWPPGDDDVRASESRTPAAVQTGLFIENPLETHEGILDGGRLHYQIYCTPCHGDSGDGKSMMYERSGLEATNLVGAKMRFVKDGQIFEVISNGLGLMSGYAYPIEPRDRWVIVAYVRTLQASQR